MGGEGEKETQTEQEWEQTMGLGQEGKWGHQWGSKQSKREARGPRLRQLLQRGQRPQASGETLDRNRHDSVINKI